MLPTLCWSASSRNFSRREVLAFQREADREFNRLVFDPCNSARGLFGRTVWSTKSIHGISFHDRGIGSGDYAACGRATYSFWHYRAGDRCPGRIDHGPARSGFAAAITGWRHGVFFTFYYIGMAILPGGAGLARDLSGSPSAPALFAAIMMLLCLLGLALFNAAKRMKRT
jgi:hypothetical protein